MTFEQLLINMALDDTMINVRRDVTIDVPSNVDNEYDVEFPVKDRSTSRKHHASKMRSKLRHKMLTHHQTNKLWYSFDYQHGDKAKNLAAKANMDFDEKEFYNEPIAWVVAEAETETLRDVLPTRNMDALHKLLDDLESKGILISSSTIDEIELELYKRNCKAEIDNNRKVVAYQVVRSDRFEYYPMGSYETEMEANEMIKILRQRDEDYEDWDYFCIPIKVYTEMQKRICKHFGYVPIPGFIKISD